MPTGSVSASRRLVSLLPAIGAVVLLRTCTFLFQPVDWVCGLSNIPLRTAVAGTFVGLIPPTVVIAVSGGGLLDALR